MLHKNMMFKDLNGNEIPNPINYIREENKKVYANNREQGKKTYIPKKIDYVFLDADAGVGGAEIWGRRDTQEDRVVTYRFADLHLSQFSTNEIKNILERSTAILEACIDSFDFSQHSGSTFGAILQEGPDYYAVNLGDGTALRGMLKNAAEPIFQLINKLHNLDNSEEKQRVEKLGGAIDWSEVYRVDRLESNDGRKLMVSASLGDVEFKYVGLRQNPDVYAEHVELQPGEEGYLLLACDGLTEAPFLQNEKKHVSVLDMEKIGALIQQNRHLSSQELAKILALAAFNGNGKVKSRDNISVLIKKIDSTLNGINLMAVFDGHGNDKVSELGSILLVSILHMFMQRALLSQRISEIKETAPQLALKLETLMEKQLVSIERVAFILKLAREKPAQANNQSSLEADPLFAKIRRADVVKVATIKDEAASFERLLEYFEGQVSLLKEILTMPNKALENNELIDSSIEYFDSKLLLDLFLEGSSNLDTNLAKNYRDICQIADIILTLKKEYTAKITYRFASRHDRQRELVRQQYIDDMIDVLKTAVEMGACSDDVIKYLEIIKKRIGSNIKPSYNNNNNAQLNSTNTSTTFQPINMNQHLRDCVNKAFTALESLNQFKLAKTS